MKTIEKNHTYHPGQTPRPPCHPERSAATRDLRPLSTAKDSSPAAQVRNDNSDMDSRHPSKSVIPAAGAKRHGKAGIQKNHPVILKEPQATEGSQEPRCCAQGDNASNDRLSAAKKFADELNASRLWKIKISRQRRWTALRRKQQSVRIQILKPWLRSTGPKTAAGKARSARNAKRRSLDFYARDAQVRLHRALKFHARLSKTNPCMARHFWPIVDCIKSTAIMLDTAIRFSSQKTP